MDQNLKLGLVQMTSSDTYADNIEFVGKVVKEAASKGADMVALPEVSGMMNRKIEAIRSQIKGEADDPFIQACCEFAREFGVWIHTGSTPVTQLQDQKFLNHSNLIDRSGEIVAAYDKIHLFDMYPLTGKPLLESKRYQGGLEPVLAQTPWGGLGMSVCYDLRFPNLYRKYAQEGAKLLLIPSAFTVPTGKAHWEVLLRARAIENGAFVVASAQVGRHKDGRETYGHSMAVDPWGRILCDMKECIGVNIVDLDMSLVEKTRAQIPSLTHDVPID